MTGKHVLELGAGIGFLGILISKLQETHSHNSSDESFSMTMSDVDENVLERNHYNIALPPSMLVEFRLLQIPSLTQPRFC